jgi:hypothetical protein
VITKMSGRPDRCAGVWRQNEKNPDEVALIGVHIAGNDLLSRRTVSSAARSSLLCSEWEQVFLRTYGHRQSGVPALAGTARMACASGHEVVVSRRSNVSREPGVCVPGRRGSDRWRCQFGASGFATTNRMRGPSPTRTRRVVGTIIGGCSRRHRAPEHEARRPIDVIKPSTVSTAPLRDSHPLHARPINLVVFQGSQASLISGGASRLDAFSGYPCST